MMIKTVWKVAAPLLCVAGAVVLGASLTYFLGVNPFASFSVPEATLAPIAALFAKVGITFTAKDFPILVLAGLGAAGGFARGVKNAQTRSNPAGTFFFNLFAGAAIVGGFAAGAVYSPAILVAVPVLKTVLDMIASTATSVFGSGAEVAPATPAPATPAADRAAALMILKAA